VSADLIAMLTTEQIIWIVVAVLVVLLILGLLMSMASKRKRREQEERRAHAEEIRHDAHRDSGQVREAELEAEQRRIEAERAQLRAQEADRTAAQHQAAQEDRIREADRVDPDVDHRSSDYTPDTRAAAGGAAAGGTAAGGTAAGTGGTHDTRGTHPTSSEYAEPGASTSDSGYDAEHHTEGQRHDPDTVLDRDDRDAHGDTYLDEHGVRRNRDGSVYGEEGGPTGTV